MCWHMMRVTNARIRNSNYFSPDAVTMFKLLEFNTSLLAPQAAWRFSESNLETSLRGWRNVGHFELEVNVFSGTMNFQKYRYQLRAPGKLNACRNVPAPKMLLDRRKMSGVRRGYTI